MGSVAKSVSSAGIEFGGFGIVQLLTDTAVTALPASLTTSIPGAATNGMRLCIQVHNHTAAGTIAVAGTAPGSIAAVNETSASIATVNKPGEYAYYVTTNVYGAVNASGVTLGSGLTGGVVSIYGIYKASRMLLGEVKLSDKQTNVSPAIQHGLNVKDRFNIRTTQDPEWEYSGPLYANNSLLWLLTAISNNQTYATIPASPTVLLAATSVTSAGSSSLTTQPTAPGMTLQLVLGGTAPATAAAVTVTGTDQTGRSITEVIIATTKTQGTFYSKNIFATVAANGVAYGAFGTGATVAVNGIFCSQATTTTPNTDNRVTFAIENYDSVASKVAAGCMVDELGIEGGANVEAKVTAKGKCQVIWKVGNRATSTNQITAPAQEPEEALTGWQTLIYLDNPGTAFGTTLQPDVKTWKLNFKPMWKTTHTSQFNPPNRIPTRAYTAYGEATGELVWDMTQATYQTEYDAFSYGTERLIQIWVRGGFYGTNSGTAYYPGFQVNLYCYYIDMPNVDFSNGKESVELTIPIRFFYDVPGGYAWNFTWTSQLAAGWT